MPRAQWKRAKFYLQCFLLFGGIATFTIAMLNELAR
jgi:hypothetical protein